MSWGLPLLHNGRSNLYFALALSNCDFFSDLLYFTVKVANGGYQHPSLTVVSFATFVAPAIACALRNNFFREFVRAGSEIKGYIKEKVLRGERALADLTKAVVYYCLLLLGPLLWTFVLLGTLVLGVNMKLFALPRFLCFYRYFLLRNGAELSQEVRVVALNEALVFELVLESLPQICIVIINESLTPGPWSSIAIIELTTSIFSVLNLLWKFADRIHKKGIKEGLKVPMIACSPAERDEMNYFVRSTSQLTEPRAQIEQVEVQVK